MPVSIQCEDAPLSHGDVERLWGLVVEKAQCDDDEVTVRCVSEEEIRRLNREYRGKDAATNVLSFSYGEGVHDVALCLDIARVEATHYDVDLKSYFSRLLVHAFLHVAGMDHEISEGDARVMNEMECLILDESDFGPCGILSVDGGLDKK